MEISSICVAFSECLNTARDEAFGSEYLTNSRKLLVVSKVRPSIFCQNTKPKV